MRGGATEAESERAEPRAVEFQLDVVIIMRDPPARRDGRWLMTRLNPKEEKYPPPRERTGPQAFPSTFVILSC